MKIIKIPVLLPLLEMPISVLSLPPFETSVCKKDPCPTASLSPQNWKKEKEKANKKKRKWKRKKRKRKSRAQKGKP